MTVAIEAGFNAYDFVGTLSFTIYRYTAGGTPIDDDTVSIAYTAGGAGLRSHSDFSTYIDGETQYTTIAADINADLGAYPVDVTYDIATGKYTFTSTDTGEIELDFTATPANSHELLGFESLTSNKTARGETVTSDEHVPYWFQCTNGLRYQGEDYEPAGFASTWESNGGGVYGVTSPGIAVHSDFTVIAETHAQTFSWKADADAAPSARPSWSYTLQDHFEHCRAVHPFFVTHETGTAVHMFRPEECFFDHSRVFPNSNAAWDVPFRTFVSRAWVWS